MEDLDWLPFVSSVYRRHLPIERYDNPNALHPQVMIIGGRGCPHRCSFCVFPQTLHGRRERRRSAGNIVDEMLWVEGNMPRVGSVFFEDDTISAVPSRLRALAELMIERGVSISWSANMRADVDPETLRTCRRAGLRTVCVGFESGDDGMLRTMRKGLDTERMRRFMRDARSAGLKVHGCFMAGFPGETRETMERTLELALELDPDTAQFYPLMVYPGTDAYADALERDLITARSWRDWLTEDGLHSCVVRTETLSGRDLVEFCDHCRRRFYLRPRYLMRSLLQSIFDPVQRRRLLRAFATFRRYLLRRSSSGMRSGGEKKE